MTIQTFFVTSYGRTATYWLTSILNSHPDIYCTHGPTLKRFTPEHEKERSSFRTSEEVHHDQQNFYELSLNKIIENMNARGKANAYGNIHAFTAYRLKQKLKNEKFSFPYQYVNLLRHPFTRIESFVHEWTRETSHNPLFKEQIERVIAEHSSCQSMMKLAQSRYNVDFLDLRNRLFVYALIQQGNDLSDTTVPCRHIRYESLVSDIEYFVWFFYYLTNQKFVLHDNLINLFHTSKHKNASAVSNTLSYQTINRWEKWKVMLVRFSLETTPKLAKLYKSFDYEIDSLFDIAL